VIGGPGGPFNTEDESVMVLLAQMASVALMNARLYQAVQSNEHRLRTVVESSPLAIAEVDLRGTRGGGTERPGACSVGRTAPMSPAVSPVTPLPRRFWKSCGAAPRTGWRRWEPIS